ncbi:MAG TPA: hypothetical protein VFX92_08980 [Candidatus Krumholzibacteria bacterium]|nr:hypothetical protein [Candidatus Krumholzibacteria bacterium]
MNRVIVAALCVTIVCTGLPPARARAARVPAGNAPATSATQPDARAAANADAPSATEHWLRDAVPAASFVAEPPDTTEDDEFFLPEETDKRKLARDITVFVIASVFVAFFIIKVFIEKDPDPPPEEPNGKPITPPQ